MYRLTWFLVPLLALTAWGDAVAQAPSERDVYSRACAACHAADGRGMPQSMVGFRTPLPDFTDCSFASREPDADWVAIAHDGGPVRAFDRRMPAFGAALTGDEIQQTIDRIRRFCAEDSWPRGELNLPRPLVTEKAYPEDETVFTLAASSRPATAVSGEVIYERRLGAVSQFEVAVPVQARDGAGGWARGLGDVKLAFKHVLAHSHARGAIVSAAAELVLPTGKEASGLGKGTTVVEPFVAFGQLFGSSGFLHAQAGVELPTDTATAGREAFWRVAIGRTFEQPNFGRAWSPMLELVAARELEDGAPTQWDAVPQVQVTLSRRQHVMFNVGVRVPASTRVGRHAQLLAYLLWDWFDGGFFDGWR
jgi:hypothetical protein